MNTSSSPTSPLSAPTGSSLSPSYTPIKKRIQLKIQRVLRQFYFDSVTFYLTCINCLMWLAVNIIYYANNYEWDCVQFIFFAKYQPSITYDYEVWRLMLSSFMFRSWVQFYFNTFALNMMGYVIQKKDRLQFLVIFYGGIIAGHMLSCCMADAQQITVGTSCGTIALLPLQLLRYIKLTKTNPIQAISRRRFLIFNIIINSVLNILAIFHLNTVDWASHLGCIVAGVLFMVYYQARETNRENEKKIPAVERAVILKVRSVQIGAVVMLVGFYFVMGIGVWVFLPGKNNDQEIDSMNYICSKNKL